MMVAQTTKALLNTFNNFNYTYIHIEFKNLIIGILLPRLWVHSDSLSNLFQINNRDAATFKKMKFRQDGRVVKGHVHGKVVTS